METEVVYEIGNPEDLQRLYRMYGWWETRKLEDVRRAVEYTDEIVGLRETTSGTLVASGRVITDYVYSGKILDVIVDESLRGEGLGKRVMKAITNHPELQDVEVLTLNCREGLVPFYEDYGFSVHDMTTELPDDTEENYCLMVRS
jgi:predicted GNAT family N-acyltransferase